MSTIEINDNYTQKDEGYGKSKDTLSNVDVFKFIVI